ncbi:hypothetical protein [Marivita sp.]|uniref:hypothetical protein n=1 Tax=Marivita sp. TaxID=2003365 RepID=UPI0025BAD875|nr:hypothetical protein [Marivita sp.]
MSGAPISSADKSRGFATDGFAMMARSATLVAFFRAKILWAHRHEMLSVGHWSDGFAGFQERPPGWGPAVEAWRIEYDEKF